MFKYEKKLLKNIISLLKQIKMSVIYHHAKIMGLASTRLDHTNVNVRKVGRDKIAILVSLGDHTLANILKYTNMLSFVFIILLLDVDECLSTPCANNGTCINNKGSYTCVCKRGWTDLNCDIGMSCNACKNWPFNKKN